MKKLERNLRPEIRDVINDVKLTNRFRMKDKSIKAEIMNTYYDDMKRYSVYCRDDMAQEWGSYIEFILKSVGIIPDKSLVAFLQMYEIVADILEDLALGVSYDVIRSKIRKVSTSLQSQISIIVTQFSPYALEYTENVIGLFRLQSAEFETLSDIYDTLNNKLESKTIN